MGVNIALERTFGGGGRQGKVFGCSYCSRDNIGRWWKTGEDIALERTRGSDGRQGKVGRSLYRPGENNGR